MSLKVTSRIALLSAVAIAAVALSCGTVTPASDGGAPGAAGSSAGGTSGSTGTAGTTGTGGTTGAAGNGSVGGAGGSPLTCHVDLNDCPQGFTCACGGPGPGSGTCTCHRNCTDATQCSVAEPMCGCPSTTGGARFCVNACFCSCG
jgi:hypothetical protein